jgi:hypothetical protein
MAASGLLVRNDGKLAFIPSALVRFIRYDVVVTPFPGTELGMALLGGRVVPVIAVGREGKALIVCEVDGETFAFSGLEPLKSGFFEGNEQQLIEANEAVPLLPIRDYIEQARVRRPVVRGAFEEDPWMS